MENQSEFKQKINKKYSDAVHEQECDVKQINVKALNVNRETKSEMAERNVLINKIEECTQEVNDCKQKWVKRRSRCRNAKEDVVERARNY